ncbi:MAG: DEAD/DEAH box helicase, partial [Candidatus Gracilibacteria bacterium]|nr:DEAD/DEAH box helicase [Candidatus Gracilibacteria bacterium]
MINLEQLLQNKFGLESFRDGQLEIIESVISKNDTLVFMPTGGGKSLTYQLPGLYLPGLTIIISPLISLMKDQVDKLNSLGIRTELINSTISTLDKEFILDEISQNDSESKGAIKFLYIAPERLNDSYFLSVIKNINISLIA